MCRGTKTKTRTKTEQSITASFKMLLASVGEGHKQDNAAILALFSRKVSVVFATSAES